MKDQELAWAIAAAFMPGMANALRLHEAVERTRLQAEMLGLNGNAVIDRAKFRYLQSPRSGTDAFIEILEDTLRSEANSALAGVEEVRQFTEQHLCDVVPPEEVQSP